MTTKLPRQWVDLRRDWGILSLYERFEAAVAFLLTAIISVVIVVALYRLIISVVDTLALRALNPLDHAVFQGVFVGMFSHRPWDHTTSRLLDRERPSTRF
jgi:hypothetical protein